ncbi:MULTISPECIES: DUF883 family protein [Marinimicrobium]|mgnify:FL=1|jgi:ElaB/YqjD/DUF883 family membrane-anchored ribosome-binding protein|uniref:ElaB/YqjD/DUF883 family membrane-anchored ribosome-binding protein n=1 Tax=Marinimicrobium koreense TaxID=306545 RepID=A0A3N1NWY2_9GAMM|nr:MULTISPECIES: DUF883 family protein [Marinimicrobium]MAN51559.1 DUF883 domain-containing protein [Marinimicrobium sp.]ROQ20715.1 ElaB/YqjD/DUF883 family membrane-anchored ribosome-binding protein [Marinimicrobium koreense]|tara:strand:- start:48 stop:416 length:369 start_codon:yes stop_codon:yes gene_type:complete
MQVRDLIPGQARKKSNPSAMEHLSERSAELTDEFKSFVGDMEAMLKNSASLQGEELARARQALEERVHKAKGVVDEKGNRLAQYTKENLHQAGDYARTHPWTVTGATLALGVAVGLLIFKRK